jgi:DnaK suppressor protein
MYGGVQLSDNPKPFPRTSPYSKSELKSLKEALVGEHARLRKELASLEELAMGGRDRSEDTTRFPAESSEYSAEMQAAETIMGVRTLEEERLEQVTEALERIDSKRNYGLCLACGNKIGIERLIAKPHAHLCMDCRRTFERKRMQEGY